MFTSVCRRSLFFLHGILVSTLFTCTSNHRGSLHDDDLTVTLLLVYCSTLLHLPVPPIHCAVHMVSLVYTGVSNLVLVGNQNGTYHSLLFRQWKRFIWICIFFCSVFNKTHFDRGFHRLVFKRQVDSKHSALSRPAGVFFFPRTNVGNLHKWA